MIVICAVYLYYLVTSRYVLSKCSKGCGELTTLLYEALQCPPIYLFDNDCCPVACNCSHIERASLEDPKKCYFRGKKYDLNEDVKGKGLLYAHCKSNCTCKSLAIECGEVECPEILSKPIRPGCYFKYEDDRCCTVGQTCPPFNVSCEFDGRIYHEGEMFLPARSNCAICVCQEGFSGKIEEPFCSRRTCIDEALHQMKVYNFCAPVYSVIPLENCCPFAWVCPADDDIIVKPTTPPKYPELKCKFGLTTLDMGYKIEKVGKGKVSCECRIPPYLTCTGSYLDSNYLLSHVASKYGQHFCSVLSNLIFILNVFRVLQ